MSDKIDELAEKLALQTGGDGFDMNCYRFKRILRAELRPLLEAAKRVTQDCGSLENEMRRRELAAELQNWAARNPDGR